MMATSGQSGTRLMRGTIYATALLAIVNAFNYMDRMVLAVLAEPIKQDLGLTDTQLGLLTGFAFVAIYCIAGLPLARLADRVGRRWVLAGALAAWSVMTVASGFARNFGQLALARVGVGIGEAGGMPSSHALLADLYPANRRALPIAIMTGGACFGIAMGLSLGGYVSSLYGWRMAFIVVGLPGILLAIVVAFTLPDPSRDRIRTTPQAPFIASVRQLFRIRTYRWLLLTHPFYTFITAGLVAWLPPFFMRSHDLPVEKVGAYFGLAYGVGMAVGGIGAAIVLQRLSRDAPERGLYLAGILMLASFPMFAAALVVPDAIWSIALIMAFGATTGGAAGPLIAGQQSVVDPNSRALASATSVFFASYIGGGFGPLLVGMASDSMTPAYGPEALRIALLGASLAIIPPGFFLMRASRSFNSDFTE